MAGKGASAPNPADYDWICRMCRERNFSKRAECFKCKSKRQVDAEIVQSRSLSNHANGTTMTGMVKSYNKKGFGFIMCFGEYSQDIYYTRENVSSRLLHPDMPGEQVSFEVYRERGKLVAKNVRPIGEDRHSNINCGKYGGGKGVTMHPKGGEDDLDRSWLCPVCREHNFSRRNECFKCKLPRPSKESEGPKGFSNAPKGFSDGPPKVAAPPPAPRKTFSPHAGARAIRECLAKGKPCDGGSSSSSPRRPYKKAKKKKKKRKSSSSRSSSSSGSSRDKKKSKKRRSRSRSASSSSRRKKSRSRSRSRSSSSNIEVVASKKNDGDSADIETAKAEALKQLLKLKEIVSKDARMTEFRALLRQWHPDKNLDRVEVATAVFQFLQKGKNIVANA